MMKFTEFPAFPHPKHLYIPFTGDTWNEGVRSLWNGQSPDHIRATPLQGNEIPNHLLNPGSVKNG
jgi:hypothetical protein